MCGVPLMMEFSRFVTDLEPYTTRHRSRYGVVFSTDCNILVYASYHLNIYFAHPVYEQSQLITLVLPHY